jgi:hypothetical protein
MITPLAIDREGDHAVGSVGLDDGRARVPDLENERLAAGDEPLAHECDAARGEVAGQARGMDERLGERLHREFRDRRDDPREGLYVGM